jgi:hypothetical protein
VLQIRDDIGKLLVEDIDATKKSGAGLHGKASYLLIGGLGGLGRTMSVWMPNRECDTSLSSHEVQDLAHTMHISCVRSRVWDVRYSLCAETWPTWTTVRVRRTALLLRD